MKKTARRTRRSAELTPLEQGMVAALVTQGERRRTVAQRWGITRQMVERVMEKVGTLDMTKVDAIKAALPSVMAVLAGAHATRALELVETDPAMSVKSTFGMKMAVEAGALVASPRAHPGTVMLTYIRQLDVRGDGMTTPGAGSGSPSGPWPDSAPSIDSWGTDGPIPSPTDS